MKVTSPSGPVFNVNTIDANLAEKRLDQRVITTVRKRFAQITAFASVRSAKPLRQGTATVSICSAGPAAQTNPTNWELGNATIDAASPTLAHISVSWSITHGQMQGGAEIGMLTEKATDNFCDAVMDVVLAPLTVANYGAAQVVGNPFSAGEFDDLLAAVPNAKRAVVLDSARFVRVKPSWLPVGFNSVYENSRWNGAEAKVVGFCCAPEALVVVSGPPDELPASGGIAFQKGVTVPGIDLEVLHTGWVVPGGRVLWQSLDLVVGSVKADTAALKLLKTP